MPDFSSRTVGTLAQLLSRDLVHSDLDNLFLRFDLRDAPRPGGAVPNKLKRTTAALTDALKRGKQDALKEILEQFIERKSTGTPDDQIAELKSALRTDGWSLDIVEYDPPDRMVWDTKTYERFELNVLGGGPKPLADEKTLLERLLAESGLATAAGHYKQAVSANADGDWAAANGQLRSAFESVLVALASKINPSTNASNGGGALNAIDRVGAFKTGERNYIDGLWTLSHPNGSHPGLSDEEESTNRLSAVTAAIAYLLRRFT